MFMLFSPDTGFGLYKYPLKGSQTGLDGKVYLVRETLLKRITALEFQNADTLNYTKGNN
jgi:hypothetical protein